MYLLCYADTNTRYTDMNLYVTNLFHVEQLLEIVLNQGCIKRTTLVT